MMSKKMFFVIPLVVAIFGGGLFFYFGKYSQNSHERVQVDFLSPSSTKVKTSTTSLASQVDLNGKTYCTAVRGNGELAPAHWAGFASMIEKYNGAPVGGAGASSATITLFMLENFYKSGLIYKDQTVPPIESLDRDSLVALTQKIDPVKLAFLFKTLPKFFLEMGKVKVTQYTHLAPILQARSKKGAPAMGDGNPEDILKEDHEVSEKDKGTLSKLVGIVKWLVEIKRLKRENGKKVKIKGALKDLEQVAQETELIMDSYYLQVDEELWALSRKLNKRSWTPKVWRMVKIFKEFKKENSVAAKKLRLIIKNLRETLAVFGKFDVENDPYLLFRPGLIDFSKLGTLMNSGLSFYNHKRLDGATVSINGSRPKWEARMHAFVEECSKLSYGKAWVSGPGATCDKQLKSLVTDYFKGSKKIGPIWPSHKNQTIKEDVGRRLAIVAATSIITGDSYQKSLKLLKEFREDRDAMNLDEVNNYFVEDRDLFFGYWYNQEYEDNKQSLSKRVLSKYKNEKSKMFLNLGPTDWQTVFATSPAEPGLTNLQPFETRFGKKLISAGGWSDPHAVQVLDELHDKNGKKICDNIFYLTRRGGSSIFGGMLLLKLLGEEDKVHVEVSSQRDSCLFASKHHLPSLKKEKDIYYTNLFRDLKAKVTPEGPAPRAFDWLRLVHADYNNGCVRLTKKSLDSKWARLSYWYNDKNPSSFRVSSQAADDTFCSYWDDYNAFSPEGAVKLYTETYETSHWKSDHKNPESEKNHMVGCW